MNNYLAPILRDQFNKFYRYGYTYIPVSQVVIFDGTINEEAKNKVIELFNSISPFEFDDDYLILHLDKVTNEESSNIHFEIQNIVSVYPLSLQAKNSIESRFDQRIKLEQPIFETILSKIEDNIHKIEITKAIDALWLLCDLEGQKEELLEIIGIENILKAVDFRKTGTKASQIKEGSFWSYLLAYDRFDYFPNSILGYFYDAGQVFAYSKKLPTFEGSGLHNFLQNINLSTPNILFLNVIPLLESKEQTKSYITKSTDSQIKQYLVAPIFLMLKDELRNAKDISQTKIFHSQLRSFGNDFKVAVILLGAFFGYKKFYDAYYNRLDLRFYKFEKSKELKIENIDRISVMVNESIIEIPTSKVSKKLNDYPTIILETLTNKGECRLSDLVKEIKKQTGEKNITNDLVREQLKEIQNIETFKDKQVEKARIKTLALFDKST